MKTPEPQKYLSPQGREIYFEICRLLKSVDGIEEIDSFGLSMMAHWLDLFHLAADHTREKGAVQVYKTGAEGISAHVTVMKTAASVFKDLSGKFGLSTKDRELILKFRGSKKDKDALDEL